jgi:hypothetical protein
MVKPERPYLPVGCMLLIHLQEISALVPTASGEFRNKDNRILFPA